MGGAPIAAINLGNKNQEKAEKTLNNSFLMLVIISIILIPILLIFKEPILYAFGANNQNIIYANEYLNVYILGTLFVMISLGLTPYISAQGKTVFAMASVLIGAILNIILDPIFIYAFDLGVKGAAIATLISQAASSLFVFLFLRSKKTVIKINLKTKLDFSIIKTIFFLGLSPFIMQSTEALVQISFNTQIKHYITDINEQTIYLSAMTIIISIMSILNMPLQGLSQGTQPIISQNYGAGEINRANEASKKLIIFSLIFSFIFVLILNIFPQVFIIIFNQNEVLINVATKLIRIMFIGMAFMGIQIGCQNSFLALGKSKISLILALLRKIILLIPLTFVLPLLMQSKGIFIAESVADVIAILVTLICYICLFKKFLFY
jgi:putative MATE family efflux protein